MRLLNCHVYGFGKLSDYDRNFTGGLNEIIEANGRGKTTLAVFIKTMLFGFAGESKRDEVSNERKRYTPWRKSGIYGGTLTFETEKGEYRVERIFDTKKSAEDSFKLYDNKTKLESNDYSSNIGEELFGIDTDSFAKTVFVRQGDCEAEVTAGINAKIGGITDQLADMKNYEKVEKELKDRLNALSEKRKTGELFKLKERLSSLYLSEERKNAEEDKIIVLEKRREDIKKEIGIREKEKRNLQEKLKKVLAYKDIKSITERRKELIAMRDRQKERVILTERYFKGRIPETAEIEKYLDEAQTIEAKKAGVLNLSLTEDEEKRKRDLDECFKEGLPKESELEGVRKNISALKEVERSKAASDLSSAESESLKNGRARFESKLMNISEIDEAIEIIKKTGEAKTALAVKEAEAERVKKEIDVKEAEHGNNKSFFMFAVGLILFVSGIFISFRLIYIGLAVAALGTVAIFYFIKTGFQKKAEKEKYKNELKAYRELLKTIDNEKERIEEEEAKVCELLNRFTVSYDEKTVFAELFMLKNEATEYLKLKRRYEEYKSGGFEEKEKEANEAIEGFFKAYGALRNEEEYEILLKNLIHDMEEYKRIIKKAADAEKVKKELSDTENFVKSYLKELSFSDYTDMKEKFKEIRDKVIFLNGLYSSLREAEEAITGFDKENEDLKLASANETEAEVSAEELGDEIRRDELFIQEKKEELLNLSQEISEGEKSIEELSEEVREKEELTEKINELRHRYDILEKTKAYLERARINFTGKYMNPIKSSFDRYYDLISGGDGKIYELDAELGLSLKEEGKNRDIRLLSDGYRDLVGLCRRMAMVDAMYKEEKPFIIFDDSFVNLDKERLKGGFKFLKELEKEYQIIYFSCHESRAKG